MNSILITIKKMLGIAEDSTHFDPDIISHINSVVLSATQLGVGPKYGFLVTGNNETWADFLGDRKDLEAVKSFIYLKVRLLFDPPSTSYLIEAIERQITELEWRLNVQIENTTSI
jgi:hypothetical protein